MPPLWLVTHGAIALFVAALVAVPMQWRHDAAVSRLERDHTQAIAQLHADAKTRQDAAHTAMRAIETRWASAEQQTYRNLRDAESEIERLRSAVDAGRQRLRVNATCPASGLPGSGPAPGVDHGTRPELDATARSAYFSLRSGIERMTAQLAACQERLEQ